MYNLDEIKDLKVGPNDEPLPFLKDVSKKQWKKVIAYYLALVSHVDDCVGKILDKLDELGLSEDTLVIFTSDHGRIQKGWPGHDCVIRVPLIMRYPRKIKQEQVITNLVEAVDISPTILDYCRIQIPNTFQGKSLRDLIEGKTNSHKSEIIVDMFNPSGYRGTTIRNNEYKYYMDTAGNEILYDLIQDPDEFKNISKEESYKEVVSIMRKEMIVKLQETCYRDPNQTAAY